MSIYPADINKYSVVNDLIDGLEYFFSDKVFTREISMMLSCLIKNEIKSTGFSICANEYEISKKLKNCFKEKSVESFYDWLINSVNYSGKKGKTDAVGDIVFVKFPYGDGELKEEKDRPAVVIEDDNKGNLTLAMITSRRKEHTSWGKTLYPGDVELPKGDIPELYHDSIARTSNRFSVKASYISGKYGYTGSLPKKYKEAVIDAARNNAIYRFMSKYRNTISK